MLVKTSGENPLKPGSIPVLSLFSFIFTQKRKVRRKMNKLVHRTASFLKRNSSTILTCIGSAGVVVTAVLAATETPKAVILLEEAKQEKGEDLTKLEAVKTAAPAYIPAVLSGVATIGCVVGANILNHRQQASLMSAYALVENSYKQYRDKVIDLYGEEVDLHIKKEIAKDKYDEVDIDLTEGKQLYFDDFSGRYFESTPELVQRAEYLLNKEASLHGYVCLNNFYELLDIPPVDGGDELGWSANELQTACWSVWIDFEHEKVLIDDDLECYIIRMLTEPSIDYLDY
jgi:hypothetical protein